MKRKPTIELPGIFSTAAMVVLCVLLGILLAAVGLALKPVAIRESAAPVAADQPAPGLHDIAYVPGREPYGGRSPEWEAKRRAFNAQSSHGVVLTEQDINRWVSTTYGEIDRTFKVEAYEFEVRPGLPTFRLDGTAAQIGIISDVKFGEAKTKFVMHTFGGFEKREDHFEFVPQKIYVGSCPIPMFLVGPRVYRAIANGFPLPPELEANWRALKDVRLEESRLKLGFN